MQRSAPPLHLCPTNLSSQINITPCHQQISLSSDLLGNSRFHGYSIHKDEYLFAKSRFPDLLKDEYLLGNSRFHGYSILDDEYLLVKSRFSMLLTDEYQLWNSKFPDLLTDEYLLWNSRFPDRLTDEYLFWNRGFLFILCDYTIITSRFIFLLTELPHCHEQVSLSPNR